jgi:hypothetical protein
VPAGVPGEVCVVDELLPPQDIENTISNVSGAANTRGRFRLPARRAAEPSSSNVHSSGRIVGGVPLRSTVPLVTDAVVATLTATVCVPLLLICTDEVDRLHVGAGVTIGVIAQLRLMVPVKDPTEVKSRLKFAVCPALMVCEVDDGVMLKSGAV